MHPTYVIKKPLLTEKTTLGMEGDNTYTFLVDRTASKDQIKDAVETIYKVKVAGVRTQVRKGKLRRLRYGYQQEGTTKKASVRLAEGQTIELI
ncbi:MAG: 50S ribosomal protein L23 [Phycisphaerales bacterium]|nr:50S ribosomal protein L23 [Phycisphaerales bacterium]